jgi:bifunctional non-homologous end joining protein LigD
MELMIEPMLAVPSSGASNRRPIRLDELAARGDWVASEKIDGIRGILYSDGRVSRLFNRKGREITERFPEVARLRLPEVVLDGEIVAKDRMFQTVATRDKQTTGFEHAARANPCMLIAFDILSKGGQLLTSLPLHQRTQLMREVVGRRRNLRPVKQSTDLMRLWRQIAAAGGEGVIAKQRSSLYLPGERSGSWVKFKTLQRITAIAGSYNVGENREFGAMNLSLLDGIKEVKIGRVGTGWTVAQQKDLKARMDAGEILLVEIEALNRTPDNALRFPVFLHERTDLDFSAATADQLKLLPVY